MAHTIYLPDGSMEVLFNQNEDFLKLVEQHMGNDAAEIVSGMMDNTRYEEIKANSDLQNYEASLESNNCAFNDLLEELEHLENQLDKQRLNKNTIYDIAARCKKIVNNQI